MSKITFTLEFTTSKLMAFLFFIAMCGGVVGVLILKKPEYLVPFCTPFILGITTLLSVKNLSSIKKTPQ